MAIEAAAVASVVVTEEGEEEVKAVATSKAAVAEVTSKVAKAAAASKVTAVVAISEEAVVDLLAEANPRRWPSEGVVGAVAAEGHENSQESISSLRLSQLPTQASQPPRTRSHSKPREKSSMAFLAVRDLAPKASPLC